MIQTLKMRKAYEYLDRAIYWNNKMIDTESTVRYSTKVEMLLNYACRLELEALGFIFYASRFDGPKLGAVTVALPGPVYPDNSTVVPYNHPSRQMRLDEKFDFSLPQLAKRPTGQDQSWARH